MSKVNEPKCGYLNMHWYYSGDTCDCGEIPVGIFFSASCTCGASKSNSRKPIHSPDCESVHWARRRNDWIESHELKIPLDLIPIRTSKYYRDWNRG